MSPKDCRVDWLGRDRMKVRAFISTNSGPMEILAEPVDLGLKLTIGAVYSVSTFGVHVVSEVTSGGWLGKGKTKEAAVAQARQRLQAAVSDWEQWRLDAHLIENAKPLRREFEQGLVAGGPAGWFIPGDVTKRRA